MAKIPMRVSSRSAKAKARPWTVAKGFDRSAPIVSVSLGMAATFLFGGAERADKVLRTPLQHGDVAVWGGVDRLRFHGVAPLADRPHPLLGHHRFNLTFRKAG